ncbi:MAG: hypothetical protein RLZZ528_1570 [Pseudomonadota bacterium]
MRPLDNIVASLLRTEDLASRAAHLVSGAIVVWLGTSVLAVIWQSPEFFSRSGAVGTGLVLSSFAVVTVMRQSYQTHLFKGLVLILRNDLRLRNAGDSTLVRQQGAEMVAETPGEIDHDLEIIGRLFARLERRSGLPRMTEVGLALISTLQWGYGDLLINRLMLCGAWKC